MDWIQWYMIGLVVFCGAFAMILHGKKRKDEYWDFRLWFINVLLKLPIAGRVLGWW